MTLKNIEKLVVLAEEHGIICQIAQEECLIATLPGDDDFLLAFTWAGTVEGESPDHELVAVTVSDLLTEVTVAAWQIPTYLFGLVLRQAQMLVSAHRDYVS